MLFPCPRSCTKQSRVAALALRNFVDREVVHSTLPCQACHRAQTLVSPISLALLPANGFSRCCTSYIGTIVVGGCLAKFSHQKDLGPRRHASTIVGRCDKGQPPRTSVAGHTTHFTGKLGSRGRGASARGCSFKPDCSAASCATGFVACACRPPWLSVSIRDASVPCALSAGGFALLCSAAAASAQRDLATPVWRSTCFL